MKIKFFIPLFLLVFSVGCFEADSAADIASGVADDLSDSLVGISQEPNKEITALLATNINTNNQGSSESVGGSLPSPLSTGRENSSLKIEEIDLKKHAIKGLPGLTNKFKPSLVSHDSRSAVDAPKLSRGLDESNTTHNFTAYTILTNGSQIETPVIAKLKYGTASSKCLIYVDESALGGFYNSFNWSSLGELFDTTVYDKVASGFAEPTDVDTNSKIVILYYDMGDNDYAENVLGFFYSLDLYSQSSIDANFPNEGYNSNEMELFYMNLRWTYNPNNPSNSYNPDHEQMQRTLAHEFQHMVNFGYRLTSGLNFMDTWIDEGLAESSEHYVFETPGTARIDYFNTDRRGLLRNGHPLIVWQQEFEDYSLSYTFMQYARIQSGLGTGMYKKIVTSQYADYRSVSNLITENNSDLSTFKQVLKAYRLANLLQQKSGIFGYGDENSTFNLTVYNPSKDIDDIRLYPSGSIAIQSSWDAIQAASGSGKGDNIAISKVVEGYVDTY